MNKIKLLALFLFAYNIGVYAQNQKTVVAIMPFVSSSPDLKSRAVQLQAIAVQCLQDKSNISLIDRSTDTLLLQELDKEIREQSMNAKVLAQQGDISGANDILIGTLTSVSAEPRQVIGLTGSTTKYMGNVSYSLQILDASTGIQKVLKNFNGNTKKQDLESAILSKTKAGGASSVLMADTKEEAIINAINATREDILAWINQAYSNIKILSVDSKDKNNYPATVAVSGLGGLSKGTSITVNEITMVDDGTGKQLRRSQKVFALKVLENQGDITECKVTDGENVIEGKMKSPSLEFIINSKKIL